LSCCTRALDTTPRARLPDRSVLLPEGPKRVRAQQKLLAPARAGSAAESMARAAGASEAEAESDEWMLDCVVGLTQARPEDEPLLGWSARDLKALLSAGMSLGRCRATSAGRMRRRASGNCPDLLARCRSVPAERVAPQRRYSSSAPKRWSGFALTATPTVPSAAMRSASRHRASALWLDCARKKTRCAATSRAAMTRSSQRTMVWLWFAARRPALTFDLIFICAHPPSREFDLTQPSGSQRNG